MLSIRQSATLLALTAVLAACTKSDKAPSASSPPSNAAAAAAPTPSAALPSSGLSVIDEATLHDFRLSDDKVAHTIRANDNLAALMKAHPELEAQMEAMTDGPNDPKSLSEFIDRIDGVPAVHQAIESAGISTRDWVLTLMTGMSAEMSYQFRNSGLAQKRESTVSPENLSYVAGHRAQLQALTKSAESMSGDSSSENP